MNTFSPTEERSKLLLEAVREIKKNKEGEDNPVQQGEVSSSKPATLANDVLGPLLLDALDGFLFVVNSQGRLVFVSENVEQFLGCSPNDLFGKSIYNIVAVRDHQKFSNSLLPLTAGGAAGNSTQSAQSLSSGGGKSKVFPCRMVVKPASPSGGNCDAKTCSYEEMHVSAVLQPFPCDLDSDLSEEKQSCLVCIARRLPLSEIHSPYASGPHTSEIFAATAVAISGGMLGRKQFITKLDSTGRILDCKASYLSQSQYQPSDLIGKTFQDFCHPSDAHAFSRHLQEVLKNGSDTSPIYRFTLGSSHHAFVQTKSVLASAEASAYPSGDGSTTLQSAAIISSHTIVRDCDSKKGEPKGTASQSNLMKSLGLGSNGPTATAAAAVTPLTGGGCGYGSSQTWPSQPYGGSGLLLRDPPSKGMLAGGSSVDGRPIFSGLPPLDAGSMPDVNFNEYFSSSSFMGSGNDNSSDSCWDMLGTSADNSSQLQQNNGYQTSASHRHMSGGLLHAKVQPLPSAVVLPCKKTSAVPSGFHGNQSASSLVGAGSDAVSGSSSPTSSLSSTTTTLSGPSTAQSAPVGTGGGAGDSRARDSPARQQSARDANVLRELLSSVDAATGSQSGGSSGGSSLPNGKAATSAAVGTAPGGSSSHDLESDASSPTTTSSAASACSGPSSETCSDDATLRQLLSANDGPNVGGSGGSGCPSGGGGGVSVGAMMGCSSSLGPGSAIEPGSCMRPSSSTTDGGSADRSAGSQLPDTDHTLLKKLLTDDASSGQEKNRERSGGLLQILLKDEQDEAGARSSRQQQQQSMPTGQEGVTATASARPRPSSRRTSSSTSGAGGSGDRHSSSGGQLSKDLSSVLSAIWERDTRQTGDSRAQKRKLSASADIDSSTVDGSEAAGSGAKNFAAAAAVPPSSVSSSERNSVLLNQLLQSTSSGGGPRPSAAGIDRVSSGGGSISSVSGAAVRNPQDSLPKDAQNYMVDVRVTNNGEPVLLFGGQELVESNMDKFAQITRRYGQYSDKDGTSVVGWLPGGSAAASSAAPASSSAQQPTQAAALGSSGPLSAPSAVSQSEAGGDRTAAATQRELASAAASAAHSSFLSSLYSDSAAVESTSGSASDIDGSSTLLLSQINELHGADDDDLDFVKKIDDLLGLDRGRCALPKSCEEQLAISAIEQQLRSIEGGGTAQRFGMGSAAGAAGMGNSYPDVQQLLSQHQLGGARGLAGGGAAAAAGTSSGGEGGLHVGMHSVEQRQPRSAAAGLTGARMSYTSSAGEYDMTGSGMADGRGLPLGLSGARLTHPPGITTSTGTSGMSAPMLGTSGTQLHTGVRVGSQIHGPGPTPTRSLQLPSPSFMQQQKAGHLQAMARPKDLYLPPQSHMPGQQHLQQSMAAHGQYQAGAFGDHIPSAHDYGSLAPSAGGMMPQQQQQRLDMSGLSMAQMMMDSGSTPYSPSMTPQQPPPFPRDSSSAVGGGGGTGTSSAAGSRLAARGMSATTVRGSASPLVPSPSASSHILQRQRSYGGRPGLTHDAPVPTYGQLGPEAGMMFGGPVGSGYPQLQQQMHQQQSQQPMIQSVMNSQPVMQRQLSTPGQSLSIAGSGPRQYDGSLLLPQQQHVLHPAGGEYSVGADDSSASGPAYAGSDFTMLDSMAEQSSGMQLPLNGQQQQPVHPQHVSSQYVRQELRAMCSARSQQQQQQQQQMMLQQQQQLPNPPTSMETSELPQDILDQISELSSEHFPRESLQQQQHQPASSMWLDQLGRYRQPMQQQSLHSGAYAHHMQPSPQMQQKSTFPSQLDLQTGQQQQQQPNLVSSRMAGYGGSAMLPPTSQQPQLSPMLPAQNPLVQQQQLPMSSCLPQPGHLQSNAAGSGHQAAMQSHQLLSHQHQQQMALQQQHMAQQQHMVQQQLAQQQLAQQQQAYLPQPSQGSMQHLQDSSPIGEGSSAGFMTTLDASSIMMSQKEEVKRRKEQFRQHKGSFPELFKSQLCQQMSPPIGVSARAPEMASQPTAAAGQAADNGKRAGAMVRPLVPPSVSILQPEPRTPIDDIRPADHTNSLLQKLLSE